MIHEKLSKGGYTFQSLAIHANRALWVDRLTMKNALSSL